MPEDKGQTVRRQMTLARAMIAKRAKAYLSVDVLKAQAYVQENDTSDQLSGLSQQVLSRQATTADAEKCMEGNSAQPMAAR
jgi:hypothetical protein